MQPYRVDLLFTKGLNMRVFTPRKAIARWPSCHTKAIIVDEKVVVNGSMNPTTNGAINNKEHVSIIKSEEDAANLTEDYWKTWEMSLPVTREMVDMVLEKASCRDLDPQLEDSAASSVPPSKNRKPATARNRKPTRSRSVAPPTA